MEMSECREDGVSCLAYNLISSFFMLRLQANQTYCLRTDSPSIHDDPTSVESGN